MGFVGGLLGMGNSGGNFKAKAAPIIQPVTMGQVNQGYNQSQDALAQQQALIQALQAQQGIQNQSNVFNQQQGLANQIQGVANGTGPNPALQQLQNTTGQNIANQAALMAGQRGSGANAGLLARQAAQQGGALQQQAVGQGAAMQAQQQLAAMQALQGQQGMMGQLAGQQVGQQQQATGLYNQAAQGEQGQLLGALGNYNQAQVGSTSSQNQANAAIQNTVAQGQSSLIGGLMGGAGAALGLAHGGEVRNYADGGDVSSGPSSFAGKFLKGWTDDQLASAPTNDFQSIGSQQGQVNPINKGMSSMVSGLIGKLGAANGGMINAKEGAVVPGKAKAKGDNYKNDTVPAMLSPKEIVLPRSVTLSDDAPEKAKAFVMEVLRKRGKK